MLPVLRQRYPDAFLAMLLSRYTGEIARGNRYLDEILWYDDQGKLVPFRRMLAAIRAQKFDTVILVHPTIRLALMMALAGIRRRVGTGYRYYSLLFNSRVYEHRKDARRHELEYNLNLLGESAGSSMPDPEFGIEISESDLEAVSQVLRAFNIAPDDEVVVLHPGSGGSAREWPSSSFAELAVKLVNERRLRVVVTGVSSNDKAKGDLISHATSGAAVSLVGMLTVRQLAALAQRASLFVSNSTGPLHIAVAVGTPVVGLYSQLTPMSAARWGPYTRRKRVFVPRKPVDCAECDPGKGEECACMASISVQEVYNGACSLLDDVSVSSMEGRA